MAYTTIDDEASSSSSYSTSIQTSTWTNHVFLSFRGEDTRHGFTDHLFASLERRGIKTFKDDYDLERGEKISNKLNKAIEESMFAIIILSPNYANSTWCLDELQKIVECNKSFGQAVFPIFYGVDPSDVRHQRGSFAKAFRKHEEKFRKNRMKVKRWREVLREVASYSGWDSKDRHEASLVETIAEHIQKKLIPKLKGCTDNLVGIDSRIKEVYSLLGMKLNDIRFIGIWGMGGIGKTTAARLVYEAIKKEFKASCFLADIRETVSKTNGLVHIQTELLSHLNIRSNNFYNIHDGKKILANSLSNKKVLLVLDDVSELSQLEYLAGKQEWFGPGSRVIITSRDKHLLMTHGMNETYKAQGLVKKEALKLFCLKAFKKNQPKEEYLSLCQEVVEYAKGLPLALEVLGSHLCGRTVEVWHSALEQIRSVPHSKIHDTLKISYDSLQSMEKNMFLDIACFFKGEDIDEVIEILKDCGDYPKIGIDILIEKSLVTFDRGDNKLWMHDLLQEMGRNIVFQESPNDPGKRSRLWSQKDIDQVLRKNKGTDKIQGIVMDLVEPYEASWSIEAFSKISQLRFLKLCEIKLPLGLNCFPSSLKVLDWRGCPLKTLPLNNHLDEIVDLKLSHSKIEQLWHGTQFLENLKSINLSFSNSLKQSPDFVGVPNLESLFLEGCTSLTEIHPSLLSHKKLVLLSFKGCKRLKTLPCKIEMSSLKGLSLSGCCEFIHLPEFDESMKNLSKLSLEETAITKLPSSLGFLVSLTLLVLENCKNLVCLPDTISELKSLLILDVSGCSKIRSFPDGLKEMKSLEKISANETAIEELPSSVYHLENLKVLTFFGCKGQVSVNTFCLNFLYSTLTYLDITGTDIVSLPSFISIFPKLEYLILNSCKRLQKLPKFQPSMRVLNANNCTSLETSKSNLSSPCILFASHPQRHSHLEAHEHGLPKARFDMHITGSEIPSWFTHSRNVCVTDTSVPRNCPPSEWVGFVLCFMLVSDQPELCDHEVTCYLNGPNCKLFIKSRHLSPMEPYVRDLYILYLSIDECLERFCEGGDCSQIEFALKHDCCDSLQVVKCGSRLVCKQDVEDIDRNYFFAF